MRYKTERHDGGRNLVVIIFISNREVSPAKEEGENIVQSDKHVCCLLSMFLSLEEGPILHWDVIKNPQHVRTCTCTGTGFAIHLENMRRIIYNYMYKISEEKIRC